MLKPVHGLWIEEVVFTFATPLILTSQFQLAVGTLFWAHWVCHRMPYRNFLSDLIEADTPETRHRSGEVFINEILSKTDCFEDLSAGVGSDRRHAHLRHHLQHTFSTRLDVVLDRFVRIHSTKRVQSFAAVCGDHVLD